MAASSNNGRGGTTPAMDRAWRRFLERLVLLCTVMLVFGCTDVDGQQAAVRGDDGSARGGDDQLATGGGGESSDLPDGVWEVAGYGLLLEVDHDAMTAWYVTASTCVKGGDDFEIDGLVAAGVGYEAMQTGVVTSYHLLPTELPATCDNPATGLDVSLLALDETFTTYYPFLDERDFDWDEALASLRARVGSDPATFERALAALTAELGDGHTFLESQDDTGARARAFRASLGGGDAAEAAIDEEIDATWDDLDPDTRHAAADESIAWGILAPDVGYLGIESFEGIGGVEDAAADLATLSEALDAAVADLGDSPYLVIDVRFNEGGLDGAAALTAGSLVDSPVPAYIQYAFAAPDVTRQASEIAPSLDNAYDGEVIVLTSPLTASAAEVFLLAVAETADATIVGQPSSGEFSEVVDRILPNGVEFSMSMEVYTTLDGTTYEGRGVPVDLPAAYDTAIDAALTAIGSP